MNSLPIISVTGTKGKTTTVNVIASVLEAMGRNVLKVDTTGHFVNGERKSTLDDSKSTWRLVPSVCPGRYLWEFHSDPKLRKNGVAVLECALGCSSSFGLGYRNHKVGVFLNVFEDHIGSSSRIQSKEDIAKAKDFIFYRLQQDDSYAVFNADDELVCKTLKVLPKSTGATLVPCGMSFDFFDIASHLKAGGCVFTVNGSKQIVKKTAKSEQVIADLKLIPWSFDGSFMPSVWNILQAAAAIYGLYDGNIPDAVKSALESVRLDAYGGRLTLLNNKKQVTIIADYAHEKVSLVEVGNLAKRLASKHGKVIGVVRLAHDRSDELLRETGELIATSFDSLIVYDKIDGYWRLPKKTAGRFPEIIGRTSQIVYDSISTVNVNSERIVREDEAIKRASEIAKPGDVVVVIVNDEIQRSIEFIQSSFEAEFL